jgi:exodeoxyribonuclease V alpha subunit
MPGSVNDRQRPLQDFPEQNELVPAFIALEGVVEEIIFRNEANGYTVCTLSGAPEKVAVGILPYLATGESVRLIGNWINHPDYGKQFQVEHYELIIPQTQEAILHYLCSGLIKGIGEKTAQKLVRQFGYETLEILRDHPEKVARLKGFSAEKAERIAQQLKEKKDYQDLVMLLSPLGIGPGKILRIYRQFGSESLQLISENPFRLADEVYGIGFVTADRLARDLGLDPASPARVASAFRFVLTQAVYNGHTYLPMSRLLENASGLLDLPLTENHPALQSLDSDHQIILSGKQFGDPSDNRVSLTSLFVAERMSAERLVMLCKTKPSRFTDLLDQSIAIAAVNESCRKQEIKPAPEQEMAIVKALQQSVLILTGGPGTGKTTIIRMLCDCITRTGGRVLLAAPTGRAARRMTESTGMEAKTLHRLLEIQYSPDDNRQDFRSGGNPDIQLACDLLIVDEASMIDVFLFKNLLDAVIPGTRLVLVGDADQLPSVGPGYVLKDLIDSELVPVARLTQIFRQSSQSLIIRNAHLINEGKWPELDQSLNSQFLMIFKDRAEEVAEATIKLCRDILPGQYGLDPLRDVQVLTPSRKGPAGTQALNQNLQTALREADQLKKEHIEAHGSKFGIGDKVMQIRNNYEMTWQAMQDSDSTGKGVFNGESGTVIEVNSEDDYLEAAFEDDRLIRYDRMNLEDLELAYAITIHKSQGSEYPVVVLVIPPGAPQLLTRNLLYTAVTRARQKLLLVTSRRTLGSMLANNHAFSRYTQLKDWLRFRSMK